MNSNMFFFCIDLNRICTWLSCVLLIGISAHASDFLGQSELIDVLPSSTQMLLTSQSVKNSYTILERTEIAKQLNGPLWQPVAAMQKGANVGSLLNPKPWLGLNWQDVSDIDQIGAVAAFLDNDNETSFVFLAKLGPNSEKLPFVQRWMASQGGVNQLQPITMTGSTKLLATKGDAKTGASFCVAFGSQWTCFSSSPKAVKHWLTSPTLKSMKESSAPGADQPVFAAGTWGAGETRFWLSPWAILSGFAKKEPKLVRSAKLFGLEGILALSGTLTPPIPAENAWRLTYNQQLAWPV